MKILQAESPEAIERCYPVMAELRPHLSVEQFRAQVERQGQTGYRLAFVEAGGEVRSAAGYRIGEYLAWGKILYVDDLVTRTVDHGTGYGSALMDWLIAEARRENCRELHLDSGVQRFGAHRFYLHKGMDITCHHFALRLDRPESART